MNPRQLIYSIALIVISVSLLISCSSPGTPVSAGFDLPDTAQEAALEPNQAIGYYRAVIDPVNETFTIEPLMRETSDGLHLWLSRYFSNLIVIENYSFSPDFWADIRLDHPLPGSGLIAYDPRLIAELPAKPGVSFHYPAHNVVGNNRVVKNQDGYTRLKDTGTYPGNANPFLAYFKDQPYRQWASTGVTSDTRRWEMDLSGFGGTFEYLFIVEVSTNFPNPPRPIIDNCPEPINFRIEQAGFLYDSTTLTLWVHDWQGEETLGACKVECPDVFDGTVNFSWIEPGPGTYDQKLSAVIYNEKMVPAGKYPMLISAHDWTWNIHMYQEFELEAGYRPPSILDTLDLPGSARKVVASGDYAYVVDGNLQIVNVANPESIYLVKTVTTPDDAQGVAVSGDYAYVADFYSGLQVVDISPPGSASIVHNVSCLAYNVFIDGNYAYVCDWGQTVKVVDISSPLSARVVGDIDDEIIEPEDFYKPSGSYGYLTDTIPQFHIINVAGPTMPYIVKTISLSHIGKGIDYWNGYALVVSNTGLEIIDVDPTYNAHIVKTVAFDASPARATGIDIYNQKAWVSDGVRGVHVINFTPIATAYVEYVLDTPGWASDIFCAFGVGYIADGSNGLVTIRL